MKRAIILSIGDELVLGQTVDTNSAWLSRRLAAVGCAVLGHVTVPDDQPAIEQAMRAAAGRCDYLVVSGGIGPTDDDLTRQALAAVMGAPLEMNEAWLKQLDEFFIKRNRPMPEKNKIQAMIPRGAKLLWNCNGTAAGMQAELGAAANPMRVFVMPGVPKEMTAMFERDVLPCITSESGGAVILSRTIHTFGLGESAIAEKLGALMKRDRNPSVGTTVSGGIVSLRVNSRFDSPDEATQRLEDTDRLCSEALGQLIFGRDAETIQDIVGAMLREQRRTVATAESCTGGLLAKMITDVPGSSDYFHAGFITYSNKSKYERLGVSMEIINIHGAVSEPVVSAMARHARRLARSDYALAISGVAGPGGGTAAKPLGTVCIALASPPTPEPGEDARSVPADAEPLIIARTFSFPGDREWVRDRAAKMALTMLRFKLLDCAMPF